MMINVRYASVFDGPLFEAFGEDGPEARCYYFVAVACEDGGTLVYRTGFDYRQEANRLATRVEKRGFVNPQYWTEYSPWDYVRAEVNEANRLAAIGATEADLEAMGLA